MSEEAHMIKLPSIKIPKGAIETLDKEDFVEVAVSMVRVHIAKGFDAVKTRELLDKN